MRDGSDAPYVLEVSDDLIVIGRLVNVIVAISVAGSYVASAALLANTSHVPDPLFAVRVVPEIEHSVPLLIE